MFKLFFRGSEEIILNPCKISVRSGLRSAIKNLPPYNAAIAFCLLSILLLLCIFNLTNLSLSFTKSLKHSPTAEWHVLVFFFCCLSIFIFLNFRSLFWDEDFPWRWGILFLTNSKSYPSKIYAYLVSVSLEMFERSKGVLVDFCRYDKILWTKATCRWRMYLGLGFWRDSL